MHATQIYARQNELTRAVPAGHRHKPRSGEGPLAEEAVYGRASQATRHPEAALMCAILQDAVETFQEQFVRTTQRAKRLGEEAEEWLFSDDFDWVFSFLSICAALDLCPEYIRNGLQCCHEPGPQARKLPGHEDREALQSSAEVYADE